LKWIKNVLQHAEIPISKARQQLSDVVVYGHIFDAMKAGINQGVHGGDICIEARACFDLDYYWGEIERRGGNFARVKT
jgi:hypothetical protein